MGKCPFVIRMPSGIRLCIANNRVRLAYIWCETSEHINCKEYRSAFSSTTTEN